jgi:hypothetical protein
VVHPGISGDEVDATLRRKRAKIAAITRGIRAGERPADDPELIDTQRDYRAGRAEEYIEELLRQAPPLTDVQRNKLAELLRPVRINVLGGGEDAA